MKKKVVFLPYDFDTGLGTDNEDGLKFSYDVEDIDKTSGGADVFNAQNSVLWKNMRTVFFDRIKVMYQNLRSSGALSYEKVNTMFEEHQAKWGEAIFNEDSFFKYIRPLLDDGTGAYLSMLQGMKTEQRKWWLYNRFRYLDSKYNAGDALSDVIQLRGYAKANVTVDPYASIYASVKYGSYLMQKRALRGSTVTLECPLDSVNDTEIYVYSASQLADIGDLSGLKVGFADFSMGTKLQSIKLGDKNTNYSNGNLQELHLGNNTLLKTLDVRNCPNLGKGEMKTVDASGCTNIEEVYFDNTAVTGVDLPNGGILKKLHLPGTITSFMIRNQQALTELTVPTFKNVSTLWIENTSTVVDSKAIIKTIAAGSRVRLVGVQWEAKDAAEIKALLDLLDTMRGMDEYGNNMDQAQVSGTIHTAALTGADIAGFNERYPYLEIKADHVASYLYYYNYDGSELLYTETIQDGADGGAYTGKPSRTATEAYTYDFAGWAKTKNATSAETDALKAVVADRKVYAAYTATLRSYTVTFTNVNGTTLQTSTVAYGSTPRYTGSTPKYPTTPEDYEWIGWETEITTVTGNVTYKAKYKSLKTPLFSYGWNCEKMSGSTSNPSYNTEAIAKSKVTKLDFVKDYTPDGTEDKTWDASALKNGGITGYLKGTEVVISYDTDELTLFENASSLFSGCSALTNLDLSNFDTSKVTSMSYMFYNCYGLTNLDLSNFDTSKVTSMGSMFYSCSKLTNLDLSNFNTANATYMSEMFRNCYGLTNLDLSNFNTANVTNMGSMFSDCSKLTNLDLSNFNTANVTSMNQMFRYCSGLTNLDLSTFDTSKVTDMSGIFNGCSGLTNLDLSNFDTSKVTSMGSMFYSCSKLTNLDLSSFNTANVTNMGSMFSDCSKLTNLDLSSFNTANVTSMSYMFGSCSKLTNLDLSNFDTSKVTSMGGMFYNCYGLTNLDLSNFNTANVTSMSQMFYYCSSLTNLDLSGFNTAKVTSMSSMFSSCSALVTLTAKNTTPETFSFVNYSTSAISTFKNIYVDSDKVDTFKSDTTYWSKYGDVIKAAA